MSIKNNVTRMLENKGIEFIAHEIPNEKLGAIEAAKFLQVVPNLVFKTIVAIPVDGGKPILAVVPGTEEVDAKKLGKVIGKKKVKVSSQKDAEKITGLQTGGISPLALVNKGFTTIIDKSIDDLLYLYISGGQRGLNIQINISDFIRITNSLVADIANANII